MGSFFSLPVGISLVALGLTALYWFKSQRKRPSAIEFRRLHEVPEFAPEAKALVLSEWPSRTYVFDEDNSSFDESSDVFPCHVIATAVTEGKRHVVAHAKLDGKDSADLIKFQQMLKVGLPVGAVKQAMQVSGVDPDSLDLNSSDTVPPPDDVRKVHVANLVVKPELRGLGLGKSMCAFAAQVASTIGTTQIKATCEKQFVPFYERLGMRRKGIAENARRDIPKVRLGIELYYDIGEDSLKEGEQLLREIRAKFAG